MGLAGNVGEAEVFAAAGFDDILIRLGACAEDQIALFVAATVVSDWVLDQVILDVGTKALGREGNRRRATAGSAGTRPCWPS